MTVTPTSSSLASLMTPQTILLSLKEKTRDGILIEMVDHLVSQKLLPQDLRDNILAALRAREAQMSTAMGLGLALPHASIPGLANTVALFARCDEGIDCAALDQQPVRLFLLILVPKEQYTTHLRTLSQAAKFFNRSSNRENLLQAQTVDEAMQILKKA